MMTLTPTLIERPVLRQAFGQFPTGVAAVCAEIDGVPVGMVVSSFVAVSLDPPLVAFCVQNTSTTWPRLAECQRVGVSILGEHHEVAARTIARKDGNRFEGLETSTTDDGAVFIDRASLRLDVRITKQVTAGDHVIVVLEIEELEVFSDVAPIVFHQSAFRRLALES